MRETTIRVEVSARADWSRAQAVKVLEEAAEAFTERERLERSVAENETPLDMEPLAEELADTITAAVGLAVSWGIDVQKALDAVAEKNRGRE